MEVRELIGHAVRIALEKKGEDVKVLDVAHELTITDYFVLVSADNRRQAQAIASAIDTELKQAGVKKARIEGYQAGWWLLLDYDAVVVHVFQKEARTFYDLEQLWADARDLTAEFLPESPETPEALRSPRE